MTLMLLFLLFFVLIAALRVPVPFSLGLAGIICMAIGGISISTIPPALFKNLNSFAFLAIPAFIFAGDIMTIGGITGAIVGWVKSIVGRFKGNVASTTVITASLFGTITGSSIATVSAIGSMMIPEMTRAGYSKEYSTALVAACGFIGVLIPPSIPGVVFALSVGLPVHKVWIATLIPGLMVAAAYLIYNRLVMAKYEQHDTSPFEAKSFFTGIARTTPKGIIALIMPLVIFVGVFGGIMTPTEAGAVAVLYGLIAGWILYPLLFKEKNTNTLWSVAKKSAITSASICLLIAFSGVPSALFTYGQVTQQLTDFLLGMTSSPIVFLILINIMLLFIGMFMETNTSILLFAPILVPAATAYGVDPIHFAAIMLLNLEMGMITPPLASNIFVACKISNLTMDKVLVPGLKLWACCLPVLIFTTFIPGISLVLINFMK